MASPYRHPVVIRTTENMLRLVRTACVKPPRAGRSTVEGHHLVTFAPPKRGSSPHSLRGRISVNSTAPLTALNNQFWSLNMNAPMANLRGDFQFAMSPYENWQHLAWRRAADHLSVLALNIFAGYFPNKDR